MHSDIVIVGGGAGGLELAARLGRRLGARQGRERVLLVDRSPFHIWKPTLHEVAAGTLDAHQEGLSYPVLARRNHFGFAIGDLVGMDAARKTIELGEIRNAEGEVLVPRRTVSYTRLVLAIGSGSNAFGTPGIEHAYLLENVRDAQRFHTDWLGACARASFSDSRALSIAIVGAGATGVELSAELLEAHAELLESLGSSQRFRLDISLVEGGSRILGGLPEKISAQAEVALRRKQVQVLTGTRVTEIRRGALVTPNGEIPADMVVWAAGIKAAEGNARLGLEVNRLNQFIVDDRLRTSAPDVLAFGDCAACPWVDGKTVPARAQAAHQQADYLAKVLGALLREQEVTEPFVYKDFGSLVSLGDNKGVGNLMGGLGGRNFFVEGLIAKWMYISLHLNHHRAILGTGKTVVLALARLLQQRVSGRLKLH
ncbi:NAD(P)/FAD-dependent oxidoreductase [Paracidovorax cattleyae]|uniref:NADH dehydrogenase n=1 Tax=Paracidovorax cattleyae TaxID=80868 RepID=A0A1H0M4P2_9BURK|nr:FAD-dependent oxidoreductase [Paracidovorax cattleyae]AVS74229.1 FAD-dependent oxidoreductase [Paracidovorax cattleyae]MBF9263558.1 FAD-dependent oxidoreductase [Paracidovorax cattleyae]SDO75393.1 NADH dehydrogenase [Paracidovorax cattleyae]